MKLCIENIQRHRNGVCGAPFYVLTFRDPDHGKMFGIVFEAGHHVAVFNLAKLALGNIAFGVKCLPAQAKVRGQALSRLR